MKKIRLICGQRQTENACVRVLIGMKISSPSLNWENFRGEKLCNWLSFDRSEFSNIFAKLISFAPERESSFCWI